MLRLYNQLVNKAPILTQSLMTAGTCAVGDVVAQKVTPYLIHKYSNSSEPYKALPWDVQRTLKFGALGLCYFGPLVSFWLRFLDKAVARTGATGNAAVIRKLVPDQFIFAPTLTVGFLCLNAYTNGVSAEKSFRSSIEQIWQVQMKAWPFWISVQILNFSLVPLNFRLLNIQIAAILWNSFLSWFTNTQNKVTAD